jgi:hypothetical protein
MERVKLSRFGRPEYLRIIEHHGRFISILESGATTEAQQKKVAKTKETWQLFHKLISLAVQPKVSITEKQWLEEAKPFGKAFTARYTKQEVTTYIHLFIYHVGFYLEKYESIEIFANVATESMHSLNKDNLGRSCSGIITKQGLPLNRHRNDSAQSKLLLTVGGAIETFHLVRDCVVLWPLKNILVVVDSVMKPHARFSS